MPAWVIWLIVIVVVVLAGIAIFGLTGRRRTDLRRERADALRQEASTQAAALPETQRQAEDLRAKADLARSEAARAEERAANAEQGHRIEQASYEDRLREADRLDPAVDEKADGYEPDAWNDERTETSGPRHAAPTEQTRPEGTTER